MHLHNHSVYSVIDGRAKLSDYLKLAQADGQQAFALTDHGTLGGAIDFYTTAKKYDIKPIIGMEMYVDVSELRETNFPGHLTVLAKNESGYRALIAANNLSHRQFYHRPRITFEQLLGNSFINDWIILSGCQSSPIYRYPLTDATEIVKQLAAKAGGFFLEFMWHPSNDDQMNYKQEQYLEQVASLHKATNLPMVITNDCHYAFKHHEDIHKQLMAVSRDPEGLEFDGEGFYLRSSKEMQSIANSLGVPDALDNAVEISKMCDIVIPEADKLEWYVPDITGGTPKEKVIQVCEAALQARELPQEYWERYRYELEVLSTSPAILNSYLVTYDVVGFCNDNNIPVAARGSMAGSLISWLMGITFEDPIKYQLSFSRAVNPARPSIPDFDLDVSSLRRSEILEYLSEKYKDTKPICAYSHYGPKGALRKVLRMEGLREFKDINDICKPLPDDWADGDFEFSPSTHRYIGKESWTEKVPEQYLDYVAIYQGLYSSISAHPSGILVSGEERELEHEIPLQWIASSKQLVSAYDMYTLKKMGLFKLDVLGLRTLDQLAYMEKMSEARLPNDNYDDPKVLEAFSVDLLAEIFQMDGYACREVLKQIRGCQTFEDIIAANTLARPGAAEFTRYYRSGYEGLLKEYPDIEPILGPTNGLILYQEQVMEIARILAEFDDSEQDDIKEAIKYFRHEVWNRDIEPLFRSRCEAKQIDPTHMLDAISRMASYTYNRAHAMTYAAIAYKMMWYKIYYPAVYYAAVYDAAEDKQRLILESHHFDVKWHPADVNVSESYTTIRDKEIYLGLSAIKGVGPAACEAIAKTRPFIDLEDFQNRIEKRRCNKSVVAKLQESFAFTSLGIQGKYSTFQDNFGFNYRYLDSELVHKIYGRNDQNHLAGFISDIRSFNVNKTGPNQGKEMAHVNLINSFGKTKCTIFPDLWSKAKGKIFSGTAIMFTGSYQVDGGFIVEHGDEL